MQVGQEKGDIDIDYIAQYGLDHICWSELLERVDNEKEFVSRLVQIFIVDNAVRIDEMLLAIESRNMDSLLRLAHSVKGAACTVSANLLAEIAKEIEAAAKVSDELKLAELGKTIDQEFNVLREIVATEGWMEILERVTY